MPVTVYSPTERPHTMAPSTKTPVHDPATCAAATVAIATWANCVSRAPRRGGAHTAGDDAGRAVADHVQYREAQGVAGNLSAVSHTLRAALKAGAHLHAHAPVLMLLAGGRPSWCGQSRALPSLGPDLMRGHVHNLGALSFRRASTRKSTWSPGTMPKTARSSRPGPVAACLVGGGHRVPRRGRQPHAVHDRRPR